MGNNYSNIKPRRVSNFGNVETIIKSCINEPINLEIRNDVTEKLVPVPIYNLPEKKTLNISLDYTPLSKPSNATIFSLDELKLTISNGFFYVIVSGKTLNVSKFTMGKTIGKAVTGTKNQGSIITLTPPVPFVKYNFEIRLFQGGEFVRPKIMVVVTASSKELNENYFIDVTTSGIRSFPELKNNITFGPNIGSANIDNVCIQAETKENGKPVEITDFRIVDELGKISDPLISSSF